MIKKYAFSLLLAVITLSSFNSFGQASKPTKLATESWLLEKMNRYVQPSTIVCHRFFDDKFSKPYECLTYKNIRFEFSGNNLVITSQVNLEEYQDKGQEVTNFDRTIVIPILDLNYISFGTTTSLSFYAKFSAMKISDSNGKSSSSAYFSVDFNWNQEENLSSRFAKAMMNLKSYLKNNKSTEAF